MAAAKFTVTLKYEGVTYHAHCLELDTEGTGLSPKLAVGSLMDSVTPRMSELENGNAAPTSSDGQRFTVVLDYEGVTYKAQNPELNVEATGLSPKLAVQNLMDVLTPRMAELEAQNAAATANAAIQDTLRNIGAGQPTPAVPASDSGSSQASSGSDDGYPQPFTAGRFIERMNDMHSKYANDQISEAQYNAEKSRAIPRIVASPSDLLAHELHLVDDLISQNYFSDDEAAQIRRQLRGE